MTQTLKEPGMYLMLMVVTSERVLQLEMSTSANLFL